MVRLGARITWWCPKYRRKVIGGRMEVRLKEIIAEVITE
jgi:putative transposase